MSGLSINGTGFRAGAIAELDLSKVENLYVSAGAILSLEGYSENLFGLTKVTASPYFLNIPVHVGYKYSVTNDFKIFGEAGPFLGLGLFGKVKETYEDFDDYFYDEDYDIEESYDAFDDEDGMKRLQAGVGIKVGVTIKSKYKVYFGYDWNLVTPFADDSDTKHVNSFIGISYVF